jgi:hypothetical protein
MSIGTIVYPAIPKSVEKGVPQSSPFDSRDVVIYCLSGALMLVVIALIVVLLRQQGNLGLAIR